MRHSTHTYLTSNHCKRVVAVDIRSCLMGRNTRDDIVGASPITYIVLYVRSISKIYCLRSISDLSCGTPSPSLAVRQFVGFCGKINYIRVIHLECRGRGRVGVKLLTSRTRDVYI